MLTKQEFLKVYDEHKPNLFLRIMYKYFSPKGGIGTYMITGEFVLMNILTIILRGMNPESTYIVPFAIVANLPFIIWGITAVGAGIMNNFRHRKIMKLLNIKSIDEYNSYVTAYVKNEFE